jgi:hypothetical protein
MEIPMTTVVQAKRQGRKLGSAVLVGAMLVVAYLAVAAGVFHAGLSVTGQTDAEASVRIVAPVGWSEPTLPCVDGWVDSEGSSCEPAASPDQWPGGTPLPVRHGGGLFTTADAGPIVALLGNAALWGGLVAGGAVGLLLIPVLRSTAAGRPFAPGNAARFGWAATTVVVAWIAATVARYFAAARIVDVLEGTQLWSPTGAFDMPSGWLAPAWAISWWPLPIILLLLALAAATRQGARLATDTEGLV